MTKKNEKQNSFIGKSMPKSDRDEEEYSIAWQIKATTIIATVAFLLIGVAWGMEAYASWRAEHQWQFPIEWVGLVRFTGEEEEFISPLAVEAEELEASDEIVEEKNSWVGKVSYYSHGEGCIGCHPDEIMANGERFDENAMTLAFNKLPLNTKVRVTNLDNGANIIATVTDTGGFEQYDRIADLSKALMTELNAKTDVSRIKIEEL